MAVALAIIAVGAGRLEVMRGQPAAILALYGLLLITSVAIFLIALSLNKKPEEPINRLTQL